MKPTLNENRRRIVNLAWGLFVLAGIWLAPRQARAQTESAQTGNWGTANTWVGGVVPTTGEAVVNKEHTVTLTAANQVPAAVTPVTVYGTLNLGGQNQSIGGLSGTGSVVQTAYQIRTLTLGANDASSAFSGTITQTAGTLHLIKTGSGTNSLSGNNSYNGATTLDAGTLGIAGTGTLGSGALTIESGATLDVSERDETLTLGVTQGLTARYDTTLVTDAGKGLTLGASAALLLYGYDGTTPPMTVSGGGALTLQSGNAVTVTVTGQTPLDPGDYTVISGGVAGDAPTTFSLRGAGRAAGTTVALLIEDGDLVLRIETYTPTHAPTDIATQAPGGEWYDAATWLGGIIPGPGDRVTVSNGVTLSCGTYALESATVKAGATLTFESWSAALVATNVTVDGTLTHPSQSAIAVDPVTSEWVPDHRVRIVCTDFMLSTNGTIAVNEKGFAAMCGPGAGGGSGNPNWGRGGGYGGRGSAGHQGGPAGFTYGTVEGPMFPGSGGGAISTSGPGGGGLVQIEASGAVAVNGDITANGRSITGGQAGGGSGGGVYIECRTFTGTGSISGKGGNGLIAGGGGGGRIAVHYDPDAQAAVTPKPDAAFSVLYGTSDRGNQLAYEMGTVFFTDVAIFSTNPAMTGRIFLGPGSHHWIAEHLAIGNQAYVSLATSTNLMLTVNGDLKLDNARLAYRFPDGSAHALTIGGAITLANGGALHLHAGSTNNAATSYGGLLDFADKTLVVPAGAAVHVHAHPIDGGAMTLRLRELQIDAGGSIDAAGLGIFEDPTIFAPGHGYGILQGPGKGSSGTQWTRGAGYGGMGGRGHTGTAGGLTYGSPYGPLQPGSGSSHRFGAGLVRIEADTVTLNGTISASASASTQGGSSGGGIHIDCRRLLGSGMMSADGGNGSNYSGGGGGGRIAVWTGITPTMAAQIAGGTIPNGVRVADDALPASFGAAFEDAVSVKGGLATSGTTPDDGEPGTFRWLDGTPLGTLILVR